MDWDTYKYKTWNDDEYRTSPPSAVSVRGLEIDEAEDISVSNAEDPGNNDGVRLPSRYLVSVVSSERPFPQPYVDNPVFFQEYAFLHRP